MSDKAETGTEAPKKKKGGIMKLLMLVVGLVVLIGGGVAGGLYAANAGLFGGGGESHVAADTPRLVPASEQKRPEAKGGEGDRGGGGGGEGGHGMPTPKGEGGAPYASNYYAMEKEFTSNLQNSVHFVQVGVAVSTPYDDKVIENLRTHEIAIRSAILMALGETTEEQVFTGEGKRQMQRRIAKAINDVLKQKEGFGGISNVYFTNFVVQ